MSCAGRRSPTQVSTRASDSDISKDGWCVPRTSTSTKNVLRPYMCFTGAVANSPSKREIPQLVETYAASSAVVEMTWIKALWESMTWRDFDILTQRRSSSPLKSVMPHVIRNEHPDFCDPESTLVVDSKGLFDALDNDLPQDDRKSALEVPIVEEFMRRAMCRPRWCRRHDEIQGSTFGTVIQSVENRFFLWTCCSLSSRPTGMDRSGSSAR